MAGDDDSAMDDSDRGSAWRAVLGCVLVVGSVLFVALMLLR